MPRIIPNREPRTKEQLLSRLLSFDFSGDFRALGELKRLGPNRLQVTLPTSRNVFEIVVRRPKSEEALAKVRAKLATPAETKTPDVEPVKRTRRTAAAPQPSQGDVAAKPTKAKGAAVTAH